MNKIILDTNVIFSAIAFDKNMEKLLLHLFENTDNYKIYVSNETLLELDEKLLSKKFLAYRDFSKEQVLEILNWYKNHTILTQVNFIVDICRDPRDNKFLELAKEIQSDYLITGDNDLLELKQFETTKILKPSEFINQVKL